MPNLHFFPLFFLALLISLNVTATPNIYTTRFHVDIDEVSYPKTVVASCKFDIDVKFKWVTDSPDGNLTSRPLAGGGATNIRYMFEISSDNQSFYILQSGLHLKHKNSRLRFNHVEYDFQINETGNQQLRVTLNQGTSVEVKKTFNILVLPGWLTFLPPILTCFLALTLQNIYVALYGGIFFGSFILAQYNIYRAFTASFDTYIVKSLCNKQRVQVMAFTLMMSAITAIMQKSGGTLGMTNALRKRATTRKKGALFTYFIGAFMFFHEYASIMVVGSTMRSITDSLNISREKLAFLVDCTASPISSLTIWVAYAVLYMTEHINKYSLQYPEPIGKLSAVDTYLQTLPTQLYPVLVLVFAGVCTFSGREFGPMRRAERRALKEKHLHTPDAAIQNLDLSTDKVLMELPDNIPCRWWNAALPICVCGVFVVGLMLYSGYRDMITCSQYLQFGGCDKEDKNMAHLVEHVDVVKSIFWGTFMGLSFTAILVRAQGLLSISQVFHTIMRGMATFMRPLLILVLSWSFTDVMEACGTDRFFVESLRTMRPEPVPALVFIISSVLSFCSGTSWGTLGVMFKLCLPLCLKVRGDTSNLAVQCISAIIGGAVFGDHCSPIADTTILSSSSCQCDIRHHINTQLPYVLIIGFITVFFGYLPCGFGFYSYPHGLIVCSFILSLIVFGLGRHVEQEVEQEMWEEKMGIVKMEDIPVAL